MMLMMASLTVHWGIRRLSCFFGVSLFFILVSLLILLLLFCVVVIIVLLFVASGDVSDRKTVSTASPSMTF